MNQDPKLKVTRTGLALVAALVAVWVGGIAFGHLHPGSWLGRLLDFTFGQSIYVTGVGLVFAAIGAGLAALGYPFFRKVPDE